MVDSPRPHKREVAVGRVIGDTANAHGKMYAASMPDADREHLLSLPHERLTPRTITDPEELAAELRRVREEGVAFDIEERNLGTCAVAAPVRDQMGNVIGSIGVIVPTGRFGAGGARDLRERREGGRRRALGLPGVRRGRSASLMLARRAAAAGSTPAAAALLSSGSSRARRPLRPRNGRRDRMQKVISRYH